MDKSRKGRGRRWGRRLATGLFSVAAIASIWGLWLALRITSEFDARGWDLPAQVYAAPLELYAGRPLSADALLVELQRLGYARDASLGGPGRYRRGDDFIEIRVRPFRLAEGAVAEQRVRVDFSGGRIAALEDRSNGPSGSPLALMQLEPLLIGSIFPAHGEDRLIVTPEEVPPLLLAALISVEDRRFMQHMGIDLRAVARAAAVNLAAGEIRQGASTLTQQLVRSYFLTTERTWSRKIQEALMALALELRYDKAELLQAYVNEIYLGQDGARAIHGFGLASRFYFGKPLAELELQEIATLIAIVRGPSYYDPRRNPERAIERRNLVLDLMLEQGVIEAATHVDAASAGLGVIGADRRRGTYYAAFLDLVRRQLANEYAREDLTAAGLSVYTTLDPIAQATVETSVGREIEALQTGRAPLEAAVIVTNPHNAEVLAVAGSRRTGFDGFNRALDARRQIGSLIKPAVYLAALESRKHTLATLIDDAPLDVLLDNGDTWSPENFDGEARGPVTAIRALAESLNMATVRLGLDTGLAPIADLLRRLGIEHDVPHYPSLLLGAVELTPLEVTQAYNSLANGGFRVPLRSVRAVTNRDGATLNRYALTIEAVADPDAVFAVNQALVLAMERGTGRRARSSLPTGLRTAGKTGTSDGLRDSWFAGFSGDRLVVTWIGNDDNAPIGLTGSTGAGVVWSSIVRGLGTTSYAAPPPPHYEETWIDYGTGLQTDADCPQAVPLSLLRREIPPKASACGSDRVRAGQRIRQWFRRVLN